METSRRTLTKGAAWAVPAVVLASAAPAFAASSCRAEIDAAFTEAKTYLDQNYTCGGQRVRLQLNVYQSTLGLNGFAQDVYVNVKNLSPCNVTFSPDYPLRVSIDVRNANVVTTGSRNRDITRVVTSWGTRTGTGESNNIASQPVGSNQGTIDWLFAGTLPGNGIGDNEADLAIGMGDGITGFQRWNSYLTITPGTASGAPALTTEWANDADCLAYYNEKLATWESPFDFFISGPKIVSSPNEVGIAHAAGTAIDTRTVGNWSTSTGANYTDGIF